MGCDTKTHRPSLAKCVACGEYSLHHGKACPRCGSSDLQPTEASGVGTVYSYVVAHSGFGETSRGLVEVIAVVELAEGPRVLSRMGFDAGAGESVGVGTPVVVEVWHGDNRPGLPAFTARVRGR